MKYLRFAGLLLAAILLGSWFWPLILLGWLSNKLVKTAKNRGQKEVNVSNDTAARNEWVEQIEISVEPDMPVPFGYKMRWAAVRCNDPERVMAALCPAVRQMANWESGLARVYAAQKEAKVREVFVSPCINGFVLVIGLPSEESLTGSGHDFAEVQLFGSHRVSNSYSWRKYMDGVCVREYAYEDAVEADEGELTPEELALGFDRFPTREIEVAEDMDWEMLRPPNEEDVLDIAAAWGVDPRFQQAGYSHSTGWLCTIA